MSDESVTIRVKPDTWKRLNDLKNPGDSFDDVVRRLFEEEENESGNSKPAVATIAN